MKCPACRRNLRQRASGPVTVDVCEDGCGGVWFDPFELSKVDERHEAPGDLLLSLAPAPGVTVDHARRRSCPKCADVVMMRHFSSPKQRVEVDECPGCGGFWLDPGELASIRAEYATERERDEAARSFFSALFDKDLAAMAAEGNGKLQKARSVARMFRAICPSTYLPGAGERGAF